MTENLNEAFLRELDRNKEVLNLYLELGPTGAFGAIMIRLLIRRAEEALTQQDAVAMLKLLPNLRETQ